MPFNGSGTYSLPAGNPVVANTTASSTVRNNSFNDIATALSNTLTKDGQSTPTANIPLGGYKLTNVGDATALQDAVTAKQMQNNGLIELGSVSGTDTITATVTPVPSAYAAGQVFTFQPAANNTGAATLNISSLGAKNIYLNGMAIGADVLVSGKPVVVRYNGTEFDIIGAHDIAKLGAASNTFAGDVLVSGNLGIGTTTPSAASGRVLEINGDSGQARISLKNTTSGSGSTQGFQIACDSNASAVFDNRTNSAMVFRNNDVEGGRLTATRFAKFSNNGTYGSAAGVGDLTANDLHSVQSDQNNTTFAVINGNTGGTVTNVDSLLATGAAGLHFAGRVNTGIVFSVAANGNVTNTNNSYGSISDERFKNLIEQILSARYYDRFQQIKFWAYTLKSDPDAKKLLGVVAQEIEEIFPGLVNRTPDLDKDGKETGEFTLSVNYSILYLIDCLVTQELQKRLASLSDRVAALEAKR